MSLNLTTHDYLGHLAGINQRQLDEMVGISVAQKEMKRMAGLVAEAEKWNSRPSWAGYIHDSAADLRSQALRNMGDLASLSSATTIQRGLLGGLGLVRTSAAEIAAQLSLKDYAAAIDISSQVKKLGYGLIRDNHLSDMAGMFSAQKAATDSLSSLTLQAERERVALSASWSRQLTESMAKDDLYRRFAETLDIRSSWPADSWSLSAKAAKHSFDHLFTTSEIWREQLERLTRPDYLTSFLSVIEQDVEWQSSSIDSYLDELSETSDDEESLRDLSNAENPAQFADILSRCSRWVKWAVFKFILVVVWPIMLGVPTTFVAQHVLQNLQGEPVQQQCVQVRKIKKLPMEEIGVELRDYRFSKAKSLVLRETPNARAAQLGVLSFGQVVAVVSVKRDWTEVVYEYGDGETISGWVFTRYLEKFRR